MILLRLFWEFFKTGLFSIGGGLATLPFLYDLSERTGWFSAAQIADMLAVSESTPGPIGVNMATYAGFETAGFWGSVSATLGLVAPGIIVIILIARLLAKFHDNRYVQAAFYGLRPASVALIAAAGLAVAGEAFWRPERWAEAADLLSALHWPGLLLAALLLFATNWKKLQKLHPAVFILFAAVVGAVFRFAGA